MEFLEILVLNAKYPQCVHSGYCCKQSPCQFGIMNAENTRCVNLTEDNKCAIHDWIIKQPFSEVNPAFGTGCSSGFNSDRLKILKEMDKKNK